MSQSFSLYGELTVRQNLDMHAHLFDLPKEDVPYRVNEMAEKFGLNDVMDEQTERLPWASASVSHWPLPPSISPKS